MSNFGNVIRQKDGFCVIFERELNHSVDLVWEAITNPDQLKIWFTDFEMDFRVGGKLQIIFRDADRSITHGDIVEIRPKELFSWTWEGELAVWELEKIGDNQCLLRLTYSKMDDQYAVGAAGGFHTLLDRLELALTGNKKTYPFGTEEFDPQQIELRESYGTIVFDTYPELERFYPVKMTRTFQASAHEIWNALTNEELTKQWYFDFKGQFKTEPGHTFEWMAGDKNKQWLHRGVIQEVKPEQKLSHTWEFPGYSGKALLTWELNEQSPTETQLQLTFEFLEVFDPETPALRRKNFVEGWTYFMEKGLKAFLASQK